MSVKHSRGETSMNLCQLILWVEIVKEKVFWFKNISFSKEFTGGTGTRGNVSKGVFSKPLLPLTGTGNLSHSFPGLCGRRNSVVPGLFNQKSSAVAFASGIVCLHGRLLT